VDRAEHRVGVRASDDDGERLMRGGVVAASRGVASGDDFLSETDFANK